MCRMAKRALSLGFISWAGAVRRAAQITAARRNAGKLVARTLRNTTKGYSSYSCFLPLHSHQHHNHKLPTILSLTSNLIRIGSNSISRYSLIWSLNIIAVKFLMKNWSELKKAWYAARSADARVAWLA